jgi:protein-S-isoprenylcysteine O-methyltransferase Ste14
MPPASAGPLAWAEGDAARWVGWGLLAASLLWVVAAQARMGSSWRIGIDKASRPPLVRHGVFAISRNPIFLGMRVGLLGLFLVMPNAFTLAILLLGEALIQIQVRLEEDHLASTFGRDYQAYRRAVRRWI